MSLHEFLIDTFYFLIASLALVPLFKLLKLGSMLGYIAAGILIGPIGLGLIDSSKSIFQLAELGIMLLLFIVGLELSPARLSQLRKSIIFEGGSQMLLSTIAFYLLGVSMGLGPTAAFIVAIALSLSSTAFALSYMTENSQLTLSHGQTSLSILLFQDLLIVPLLAILPLFGTTHSVEPPIIMSEIVFKFILSGTLALLCFFALRPAIALIKKAQDPEISLAAFLFLIIGMATGMEKIGLSMPMGAFIAGVFLANSEVKTNIKRLTLPFKGILMGLFFMTLGIDLDFNFLIENIQPISILCLTIIITKSIILTVIGRIRNGNYKSGLRISLLVSQAGEFGIVVIGSALHHNLINTNLNKLVVSSILITMIMAPFIARVANMIDTVIKTREANSSEAADSSNIVNIKSGPTNDKKAA